MKKTGWLFIILVFLFCPVILKAQTEEEKKILQEREELGKSKSGGSVVIDEKSALELFDNTPSFGIFRDNYFVTGVPTNRKIDKNTADAKFQISIRQRLTKSILPFKTFLYLTYTQKSFWDIYGKSSPFLDNNFNPGLSLSKALIYRNQLMGMAVLSFEHESNGRDSLASRSWNYISLVDKEGNPDLLKYKGYGFVAFNYQSADERLWCSAVINPRRQFIDMNTTLEVNFKPSRKANEYFFVQYYNGYAENLLEYDRYVSMVRFGICIKPALRNYY